MIPALGSLHTGRMVLTPADPLQAADQATTNALLRETGLAGAPRDGGGGLHAGAALATLVGFTGCAVRFDNIETAVTIVGPWLLIPSTSPAPRLLWGRNSRPPRCPACAAPLRPWQERLPMPGVSSDLPGRSCDARASLCCDACDSAHAIHHWHWGRHAGAGRSLVLIEEVFPGEARPLPALMQALVGLGVGPWSFFYVQD